MDVNIICGVYKGKWISTLYEVEFNEGRELQMEEIYRLKIQFIQPKEQIRVICEECSNLANYLVNKGNQEKYLCRIHLQRWIKTDNVHCQVHQE